VPAFSQLARRPLPSRDETTGEAPAVGFTLLASVAAPCRAQARTHISVDIALTVMHGYGGEFTSYGTGDWRVGASVSRVRPGGVGPFLQVADGRELFSGDKTVCDIASNGGCKPTFPRPFGPEALIGVTYESPMRWNELRLGVGRGRYTSGDTHFAAWIAQLEGAQYLGKLFGLVFGGREMWYSHYKGEQLRALQWNFGLRLRR
jgi:hypothetical protein